jgi:hypothetical protein
MNLIVCGFTRVTLVLALAASSLFAQTFEAGAIQPIIDSIASFSAVANDGAVAKYKQDYSNWALNVELNKAAGQPAVEAPVPPTIRLFDADTFTKVFNAYFSRCALEAPVGRPCGVFDYSSAFTSQLYPAIAQTATKPPPAQPENPVGTPMGGGYYGVAPGDLHSEGFVFTNPVGVKFRKYVVPSPFGVKSWYQVVE